MTGAANEPIPDGLIGPGEEQPRSPLENERTAPIRQERLRCRSPATLAFPGSGRKASEMAIAQPPRVVVNKRMWHSGYSGILLPTLLMNVIRTRLHVAADGTITGHAPDEVPPGDHEAEILLMPGVQPSAPLIRKQRGLQSVPCKPGWLGFPCSTHARRRKSSATMTTVCSTDGNRQLGDYCHYSARDRG